MNCDDLKRSIFDYTEQRLPDASRADFERHMEECPPCGDLMSDVLKLSCREFVEFLHDYFEGELPAEQRSVFDRHMELCPPCKDYLDSYETTIRLEKCCTEDGEGVPADVPEALVRAILKARGQSG